MRASPGHNVVKAMLITSSVSSPRQTSNTPICYARYGDKLTETSSQFCTLFTPSPTALNPSLVSSSNFLTLSLRLSLSLFVPTRLSSRLSLEILPVSVNSCEESLVVRLSNSGESEYPDPRVVVGWASREGRRSNDILHLSFLLLFLLLVLIPDATVSERVRLFLIRNCVALEVEIT